MTKRLFLLIPLLLAAFISGASAQKVAIKNNLVYDAAYLTPNLAIEIGLGRKITLELGGGYNPISWGSDGRFKHYLVQPELRFWTCEAFNGTFFGLHLHGGEFNVAGLDLPFNIFPSLTEYRYQGYFWGAGLSVGHQWIISPRWGIEATVGGGYARLDYDKDTFENCPERIKSAKKDYFGITRAGISFLFFFK